MKDPDGVEVCRRSVFATSTVPRFVGQTAEDAAAYVESEVGPWAELLGLLAQHDSVPGELLETIGANLSDAAGSIAAWIRGDQIESRQVVDPQVRAQLLEAARVLLEGNGDCATLQREYADRLLEAAQRHVEAAA